jgi:hypothetical protein
MELENDKTYFTRFTDILTNVEKEQLPNSIICNNILIKHSDQLRILGYFILDKH